MIAITVLRTRVTLSGLKGRIGHTAVVRGTAHSSGVTRVVLNGLLL